MIVGISGYGYTGASAALDLLKEYDGMHFSQSGRVFEFCLPYEPDGLMDLEYHLTKAPAKHLKGDTAIRRFKQYTDAWSRAMNRETNGEFTHLTQEYINSLVQVTYKYRKVLGSQRNKVAILYVKLLNFMQRELEDRLHRCIPLRKEQESYICVCPEGFQEKTRDYVRKILRAGGLQQDYGITLVDQPFPPNDPEQVFHFFDDPYAIVVDRDPRDIYLTVKRLRFTNGRFIPHDNVEDFVKYYRAVRARRADEDTKRVLRINFEDLLYNLEETERKIEEFLGISQHTRRGEFFKPELSIRNTQLKDAFPDEKEDIAYIERELEEYLFPFEKYHKVYCHDGIFEMAKW